MYFEGTMFNILCGMYSASLLNKLEINERN